MTPLRWLILGVLVSALLLSGYHRARARASGETVARRREGSAALALRAVMGLSLFGGVLLHALRPEWMTWASVGLSRPLRWAGLALAALALPAIHWVLGNLGRNVTETVLTKERHELVTSGPYRWIRHPLYTTGLVLLLGLGLAAGSWFVPAAAGLAAALIRWLVVPREEAALLAKFGDRYRSYMAETGRLLPRWRSGSGRDTLRR